MSISMNLHHPVRPVFRIHHDTNGSNVWLAFEMPDDKGNEVTVFFHEAEQLEALVEVAQKALRELKHRAALIAAFEAADEPAPTMSLKKALGPVGSF